MDVHVCTCLYACRIAKHKLSAHPSETNTQTTREAFRWLEKGTTATRRTAARQASEPLSGTKLHWDSVLPHSCPLPPSLGDPYPTRPTTKRGVSRTPNLIKRPGWTYAPYPMPEKNKNSILVDLVLCYERHTAPHTTPTTVPQEHEHRAELSSLPSALSETAQQAWLTFVTWSLMTFVRESFSS